MKKIISTHNAPQAIGPYSQAVVANGFVFCSGQVALNTDGTFNRGDVVTQTHQAMKNLEEVLKAAGSDFSKVVKSTIFLADMNDYGVVNEAYGQYFEDNPPARSTVEVARLPKDMAVEIEVIAIA